MRVEKKHLLPTAKRQAPTTSLKTLFSPKKNRLKEKKHLPKLAKHAKRKQLNKKNASKTRKNALPPPPPPLPSTPPCTPASKVALLGPISEHLLHGLCHPILGSESSCWSWNSEGEVFWGETTGVFWGEVFRGNSYLKKHLKTPKGRNNNMCFLGGMNF